MEKIIFRKFLYDLISFFLIVSLSLSLIVWIIQSVNYLDFISKDGHGFKVYFAFIALNFPKIFFISNGQKFAILSTKVLPSQNKTRF